MFKKGMTYEEVMEMTAAMGWEVVDADEYERSDMMTIWQGEDAVGLDFVDGKVTALEFIPAWAF